MTEQCEGASAESGPDANEVRTIVVRKDGCGSWGYSLSAHEERVLVGIARAWLRSHEQMGSASRCFKCREQTGALRAFCEPCAKDIVERTYGLTIEQVVAACDVDAVLVFRHGPGAVVLRAEKPAMFVPDATGNTMDEAIQQLGRDAIAKIKGRHAADAAKLRELGVSDV